MSDVSARLELPYILPAQAQKHVTHNEGLVRLDALVQLVLEARAGTTPPTVAQEGQVWALGDTPTGAWDGQGNRLAQWINAGWSFITPQQGWTGWDRAAQASVVYDGAQWGPSETTQNIDGLGIGTGWDATNRLAVAAEAALLSHDGAGHQLKINKATTEDTASLLYQTNFVGHAEMGLAGNDGFSIKVSPDGDSWTEALVIDAQTGHLGGAGVQADVRDTTPGRLLAVGAFGMSGAMIELGPTDRLNDIVQSGYYYNGTAGNTPGNDYPDATAGYMAVMRERTDRVVQIYYAYSNGGASPTLPQVYFRGRGADGWSAWSRQLTQRSMVGAVSQVDGAPTGAVIERGTNANGTYIRFADGTQICTRSATLSAISSTALEADVQWAAGFGTSGYHISFSPLTLTQGTGKRVGLWFPTNLASGAARLRYLADGGSYQSGVTQITGQVMAFGRWF